MLGASSLGEAPRHIKLPLETAELDVVRVTSASNVRSTTPRSEERALEEWVPLRFCLYALIAIGFRRGDRKPAGIGRFRAKTNGTDGMDPAPLPETAS